CDIFRRAGDRWGLASSLWRTADLAFARGRVEEAEAALEEARAVVAETTQERWLACTVSGLAEAALLKGDVERAATLFGEARERYLAKHDTPGVAAVEERMRALSNAPLRSRK